MQDRYTGDIGDFGKLGLLRILQSRSLTIGVNWYLTPDEDHNDDGKHTKYLKDESYRKYDEALWLELNQIVDAKQRKVSALQNDRILQAVFYDEILDFTGKKKAERILIREEWHKQALDRLSDLDIVFVDPDNGFVVPSVEGRPKENKYVKPDELLAYYHKGTTVIFYQHKARKRDEFYVGQHRKLIKSLGFAGSSGLGLKFKTTSQRYYFFILQPQHREIIEKAVKEMISSAWGDHFCVL